jgi:Family of unknown function (DUF6527)
MQKLLKIKLLRVRYVPKKLEPGFLYVAEEFGAAVHLCACGCGAKVSTPLGPTEWSLKEIANGPSLHPCIGNWQFPCKSHYWISGGEIIWAEEWTPEQIAAGQVGEDQRRRRYYEQRDFQRAGILLKFWLWLKRFFR